MMPAHPIDVGGRERSQSTAPRDADDVIRALHEHAGDPDGLERGLAAVAAALRARRVHLRVESARGVTIDETAHGSAPAVHESTFSMMRMHDLEPGAERAVLTLVRSSEHGDFDHEEHTLLRRLAPHVAIAWRNARRSRSVQSDAKALRAALDSLPNAVAIIDRDLRVTSANDLAEELLDGRDRVRLHDGKLVVGRGTESALAAGIEDVLRDVRSGQAQSTRTVAVARDGDEPLSIVLTPLGAGPKRRASRLLAIFANPSRSVQVDPERVAALHGLTKVEADLAAALVEGLTVAEFADRRGCAEQTARTHLKRVLEKTRTNRQTDLVRLLLADMAHHQSR